MLKIARDGFFVILLNCRATFSRLTGRNDQTMCQPDNLKRKKKKKKPPPNDAFSWINLDTISGLHREVSKTPPN